LGHAVHVSLRRYKWYTSYMSVESPRSHTIFKYTDQIYNLMNADKIVIM